MAALGRERGTVVGTGGESAFIEFGAAAEGVDPEELGDGTGLVEIAQVVGHERLALGIACVGKELALGVGALVGAAGFGGGAVLFVVAHGGPQSAS